MREKAGHVFAKIEGTEIYQVKLKITDKVLDGSCDCPASENFDFCKHCVATALAYKDKWDALPNLHNGASYVEKRPYEKLLYILMHQVETEHNISREITLKTKVAIDVRDFIELAELNLIPNEIMNESIQSGSGKLEQARFVRI